MFFITRQSNKVLKDEIMQLSRKMFDKQFNHVNLQYVNASIFQKLKAPKMFKTIRNKHCEHANDVSFYLIIYF